MTVRNDCELIKTIFVNASEKSDQCCGDTTDKDTVVSHEKSLCQRIKDEGGKK